jgi:lipopolysaccharide exporter
MGNIGNYILKRFPLGIFAKHVATMMTGSVFAGVIGIIVMPLLTRIYRPEDFGIFTLYTSLLGVLAVVACWRYELAIVLPERDEDAANLLLLCIIICLGMGFLTLILAAIFRTSLANLLNAPELASWLWYLPLSLIAVGLYSSLNYWSTRRKHFKRLAIRQMTQSGVTAVTQIAGGWLCSTANAGGLIGGTIAGQLTASGWLAWQIKKDEGMFIYNAISRSDFIRVVRRYKKFPLFDAWSGLLNTFSGMLPALLLGYYFSPDIVGFYALGYLILHAPMSVVGLSIAQVFFPHANEAKRNWQLSQLTLKIFDRLLKIGFVPFLLLTIVAPDLFALIFGSRWYTAGEYVRWLSVWMLFVFISSPLSNIYSIMEKQKEGLIVNIVMFCSRLIVLVIGGMKGDALFTIKLFGITGAVLWIFNCIYIQHLAGVSAIKIFLIIFNQSIYGIPYALLPVATYFITQSSLAFVLSGIGAGVIFLLYSLDCTPKVGQNMLE